ncbi:hypothetical protein DMB66_44695 [Actinoplanes sp. ATCC 53533]|nr:hypothetical protein DMB66_44695 [Actinoplanes sp. ATCC 53533]
MLVAASIAVTFTGSVAIPADAIAAPPVVAQAAADPTTIDEKYAAAAVLGWVPREEVSLSDRDFASVLWEKASERHNSQVKAAALAAFSDGSDAEAASAEFIRAGIFAANDRDVALKARKAQLDTIRLRAAQEINWVPANNTERSTMLDQTLQNFLLAFWRKAATWPEVKAAAEPLTVADATDEQRLDFLEHALFDKAESDRQNEIANGNAEEVAARQAAALRSAKEKAIATALKRSATPYELDDLEMRELIHLFATDSTGRKVKAEATIAYANPSEEVWVAYVFTGVHLANKVDLDERDLAEARANEVKVRDIMYAAEADGYKPTVVAASKKALEGVALDRSLFLLGGHDTAREADYIRPSAGKILMFQAAGFNGCAGDLDELRVTTTENRTRVDPCNDNLQSQRWELVPDTTAGRYKLQSRGLCLLPERAKIQQDGAPIVLSGCSQTTGAFVWELLDGGQGNVEIRNVTSNKVITAVPGSVAGALTMVQNPNGHLASQQWRLIDPSHQAAASASPVGSFRIKGSRSGRCVRPAGALDKPGEGALKAGATMELRDCGSGTEQIWDVTAVSGTRFKLQNRASQQCLFYGAPYVQEYTVSQGGCSFASIAWTVMFNSSAGGYLRSLASGSYLGVRDAGTANGSMLSIADYAVTNDQRWILEPVSAGATQPQPIWASTGKPHASFAGTAVTFVQQCSSTKSFFAFDHATTAPKGMRAHTANTIKNLVRADVANFTPIPTEQSWQFCAHAVLSNTKLEISMKSIQANAWAREVTNPSAGLAADQASAANAGRFILHNRIARNSDGTHVGVLQSKTNGKYAVPDTAATGTLNRAIRFTSATQTVAAEFNAVTWQ